MTKPVDDRVNAWVAGRTADPSGRPRVLHVITSTDRRGAEILAVDLSDELEQRGWSSLVVALDEGRGTDRLDVPSIGAEAFDLSMLRALRAVARAADVVVAHGSRAVPAVAVASVASGVPHVARNIGDPRFWAPSGLKRARTGWALRRATAVVALTASAAVVLHDHYRIPVERITVIPRSIDIAGHRPATVDQRRHARAALGIPDDADVVVFVGALSPEKDPNLAVRAVAAIDGAHLLVVGGGPLEDAVEREAAETLGTRAHVLGQRSDVGPAYQAADALVLTSHTEGLPGVLIEAALRELPVVTTDVGFVRDLVVDGETGRIVTSRAPEAIATALREVLAARERCGPAARAHSETHFDLDRAVDRWDGLLHRVARR
jgi:glycosyltransferase involved in cell wall biosynthesis